MDKAQRLREALQIKKKAKETLDEPEGRVVQSPSLCPQEHGSTINCNCNVGQIDGSQ
jgi:hypothetical protein